MPRWWEKFETPSPASLEGPNRSLPSGWLSRIRATLSAFRSSEVDYADAILWLASHGLALETTTKRGHTALHIASALGHAATARALLDAGANPLANSPEGTPLDLARAEGRDETSALLSSL